MQENKTNRLFLIASLVLGLFAAVVAFAYLDRSTGGQSGAKVSVAVAKVDLRENTALDPERDFKEMQVPASYTDMVVRAVKWEDRLAYKGQRVNRFITSGTPVWIQDVAVGMTDLQVRGDKRAMSILVKGAQGLSGLFVPGDYVKLYIAPSGAASMSNIFATTMPSTMPTVAAGSPRFQAEAILPDPVRLLAVGPRLSRNRQQPTLAEQYQAPNEPESQQTITVEVTEQQIVQILSRIGPVGQGQIAVTAVLCPKPAAEVSANR